MHTKSPAPGCVPAPFLRCGESFSNYFRQKCRVDSSFRYIRNRRRKKFAKKCVDRKLAQQIRCKAKKSRGNVADNRRYTEVHLLTQGVGFSQ